MSSTPSNLVRYLHMVAASWRNDPRDDAELLVRFAQSQDEAAFATLVCRHGPLVWRTCLHILGNTQDAEDAFQASFLALARKARRVPIKSLAGWLHRVARQAALDIRSGAQRRRSLERRLRALTHSAEENTSRTELYAALDEELACLPERLRVPLLLHYLEGRSQVEVARFLGCARSILQKRLTQGEAILRKRLECRGLTVSIVSVGALLGSTAIALAVPDRLIGSTARAAVAFRSGGLNGETAEAARAVLGVLPSSLGTTIARKSLWIVLVCICSLGVGLAAWQVSSAYSEAVESPESEVSPKETAKPDRGRVDRFGDPLPQAALARLGTVRLRHAGIAWSPKNEEAESMVFSRDGKVLITSGGANPIRLWDTATGKLLRSFGDNSWDPGQFMVLSPDGNILATGNDNNNGSGVSLWEVATGKLLNRQLGRGHTIITLTFSRDGRTIRSVDRHKELRDWKVPEGKNPENSEVQMLEPSVGHLDNLSTAVFSSDSKTLATIVNARDINKEATIVYLWETATGKELLQLSVKKRIIRARGAVAFSGNGRLLAMITTKGERSPNDGVVHLWEVATGKELRKWTPDKTGTYAVAFSPDGKLLATGSGFGPIRLWEVATGKELHQCQDYQAHVVALAFSSDGSTLASLAGMHDHTARLWEVASGKERLRPSGGHVGPILSVAFSADGKSLISGGRDGLVGLWNAETGQERRAPLRAGDFQALAALALDGKTLLTGGNSFRTADTTIEFFLGMPSVVCVWDRVTGQKLRQFRGPVGVPQSLALSPDGKVLLWTSY